MGVEVMAATGLGLSAIQGVAGLVQEKKARQAAEAAYNKLKNMPKQANAMNAVGVPVNMYDQAQANINQQSANMVDAAREAGSAAVLGSVGTIQGGIKNAEMDLTTRKAQDALNLSLEKQKTQQQIDNDYYNFQRQLEASQMEGAQLAAAQGATQFQQALSGATQNLTSLGVAKYKGTGTGGSYTPSSTALNILKNGSGLGGTNLLGGFTGLGMGYSGKKK